MAIELAADVRIGQQGPRLPAPLGFPGERFGRHRRLVRQRHLAATSETGGEEGTAGKFAEVDRMIFCIKRCRGRPGI